MRVELDLLSCKDNGECVISAPHIFSLDENSIQSRRQDAKESTVIFDISEEYLQELEEAVIVCPMQAISILQ